MEKVEKERKQKLKVRFVLARTVIENSKKNSKTIEKIKKIPLWLYFNPKSVGKSWGRGKIKIIVPFRPYQTHNLKFQKKSKKIQKIKKFLFGFISSQNRLEMAEKERK